MFIGQRFLGVRPDLVQHRYLLGARLAAQFADTVAYGPFRGLRLGSDSWWSGADRGAMLLGMYEQEVLEELARVSRGRSTFVDVGAADGYYALGALVGNLFNSAICFETSAVGREMIARGAELNGVRERISVYGEAGEDFLECLPDLPLEEAVFLFDIEGGEFDLLGQRNLSLLSEAVVIVEIHASADGLADLVAQGSEFFDVRVIHQGSRDPGAFPELSEWCDDDRWLICSESRSRRMSWIVLEPRDAEPDSEELAASRASRV